MGSILEATILHHVCITLFLLWVLNFLDYGHSFAYILCFVYLFFVHEAYVVKLKKKLQFQEKKEANQRRILLESESVRWLNYAVEKIWPICMEEIVSQKMLLPIVPWFLQKYKPWTVKDVALQHLYLGKSPPAFTDMRIVQQSNGDDHLVMELGMNFLTEDMSAILGVKLRKSLGFGMLAKLHLLGLHVEGKVLVGVKFLRSWPFISRLRVCFVGPPYFQMTVKPIFTRGLDVTELPGIAGWIDNLLALVFEQTLVEPSMLVVDVEKFVSPQQENWFSIDAKEPIANAVVEVLEAAEMKPSDMNGLADPYVKGQMGPYRFRTKTQKKTLTPKWLEEFKIPICSWESQNTLVFEVRDKDHLFDDLLGECCININELRDGQRHDLWLPLQNVKMGRLHLAVTVSEVEKKDTDLPYDAEGPQEGTTASNSDASSLKDSFSRETAAKVVDKFEPIDVEGQAETGIWIHHPGSEIPQVWEPRKGKTRGVDVPNLDGSFKTGAQTNDSSSTEGSMDSNKPHSKNPVLKGLRKLGSAFRKSPRAGEKSPSFGDSEKFSSPNDNIRSANSNRGGVKLMMVDESMVAPSPKYDEKREDDEQDVSHQRPMRDAAKGIVKQAGKSARSLVHALSSKTSSKSKDELGSSTTEKGEDSSGDESLSSVRDRTGLVISGSAVSPPPLEAPVVHTAAGSGTEPLDPATDRNTSS